MDTSTFFEKFELIADIPDAIGKMRELVLHLAVSGRIVEQNANEESASELLNRVSTHAKVRRSKKQNGEAIEPFGIPESWQWVKLPRVLTKLTDGTHHSPPNIAEGEYKYVTAKNIKNDGVLVDGITYVTKEIHDEIYSRCDPEHGDVLYIKDGATTGIATINQLDEPFSMLSSVALLKPSEAIFNRYLLWVMRSPFFYAETRGAMKGAAITRVTLTVLGESLLPLPPLAEQKRIVAKVDELMALCDQLEAQQQEREQQRAQLNRAALARFSTQPTVSHLQLLFYPQPKPGSSPLSTSSFLIQPSDFRKAILTLAVQGKLVPQDPGDEPTEELLAQSLAERRNLKRTKNVEVIALSPKDALDYEIPKTWRWQRLDDLLIFGPTNGFSPKAVDYETPVRSLTLSATTSGKFKGEYSKFITTEVPANSDLWLRDNDILVQRGNTIEYVGVAAIYRGEPKQFIYPDLMMKLRVSSAFDVDFIHLAMSHNAARDFLRARASGTSGSMPKINQKTLKSLPIPIPPLAEQRRIVAKVDQLMALVDQLEAQLEQSRSTAKNLLTALVAELTSS